jgi:ATP-binding cassette subfamily F protein 3
MIQIQNISLAFGSQVILDRTSWGLRIGKRFGLVGPNGAGKSTLLKLLSGELSPDDGSIVYAGQTVGYLRQETEEVSTGTSVLEEAMTAFQDTLDLEVEEQRLIAAMEAHEDHTSNTYQQLMRTFDSVHQQLLAREIHLIKPRTQSVLSGLGFEADDFERELATFSGGWRMRVALAKLLLRQPDVLLLDEPTNHLDIDSIDWLEDYLKSYPGTVVLVSHDRYFLDRMADTTVELIQGKLTEYAGNYSFYLHDRVERREIQRSAWINQQKMISDNERFIERFRYKNTKATQVQSRVKMLDRLERIPEPPSDEATISFRFPEPPRSGKVVMELGSFSKTYPSDFGPDIEVFRKSAPIHIERGDKIALIGRNGAGKSTLARMLLGTESFDGERKEGYNAEITFFAQHQAETLDRNQTALEALRSEAPDRSETELRTLLGAFLFRGDDVFKPVKVLSGGERSRVALARTLASPANLLILDEPTNHLDIQSIAVLAEALRQYTGTFLVVSHNRHFLDEIVTKVWRAGAGSVQQFEGNYSDYLWQVEHGTARADAPQESAKLAPRPDIKSSPNHKEETDAPSSSGPKSKEQKRREAKERARKRKKQIAASDSKTAGLNDYQLKMEFEKVSSDVEELESSVAEMEGQLADPALFSDPVQGKKLMTSYESTKTKLDEKTTWWEQLAEAITERDLSL